MMRCVREAGNASRIQADLVDDVFNESSSSKSNITTHDIIPHNKIDSSH